MMLYELQRLAFVFGVLMTLIVIVKYERRLKRWALKSPGRRRKHWAVKAH